MTGPPARIRLSAAEIEALVALRQKQEQHVASILESRGLPSPGVYRLETDGGAFFLVAAEEKANG